MYNVTGIFVQGNMPIIRNICISVFLVILLIALPMLVLVLASMSCVIGIMMLMPIASHDQRIHVAPLFDNLDLRNAMLPLVSYDSKNGIMLCKQWGCVTLMLAPIVSNVQKVRVHLILIVLT